MYPSYIYEAFYRQHIPKYYMLAKGRKDAERENEKSLFVVSFPLILLIVSLYLFRIYKKKRPTTTAIK